MKREGQETRERVYYQVSCHCRWLKITQSLPKVLKELGIYTTNLISHRLRNFGWYVQEWGKLLILLWVAKYQEKSLKQRNASSGSGRSRGVHWSGKDEKQGWDPDVADRLNSHWQQILTLTYQERYVTSQFQASWKQERASREPFLSLTLGERPDNRD